jgi:acetylornithine deacetylase/succinyl-diaminopimelate desuccinylase-like protein
MLEHDLRTETAALLADLIRIDTTNPPGNETPAAEHLAGYLAEAGVHAELHGRTPERTNLVARLRGTGDGPSLMLLGHTDVVLADPSEWSVPPFSGLERDGHVWGRGALDMKGQVAAEAVAVATLAREGWSGGGDLVYCAVADEEVGDGWGMPWLIEHRPDLVRVDYVVNEGGGERVTHGSRVAYTIGVGEKQCSAFAVTTRGRSGHASVPGASDNALLKLIPVLERIDRMTPPSRDLPELHTFLRSIGADDTDPRRLMESARAQNPLLAEMIEPMLGATIAPTGMSASTKINVIPGRAQLRCDCRILPGMTQADVEGAVREALAGLEYEFEFIERDGGTMSSPDSPLYAAIEEFLPEIEPGATAAPVICSGFTDSHWMRGAFGSVAYGFMPTRMDPMLAGSLVHSSDERIPLDDLDLGVRFFMHVARAMGAAG